MADSMCGPSNALNTFQKHTSVDRTLQQDRLVQRQSASQGFRSSPGLNAGFLDPEFEAFQAGRPPLESQAFSPPQAYTYAPQPFQQAGPLGWASDFQRLNGSSPSPQLRGYTPQRHDEGLGEWHQEFVRQQGLVSGDRNIQPPAQSQGMGASYMMGGQYTGTPYAGSFGISQVGPSTAQQTQPELFDEEAFARAFAEAASYEDNAQAEHDAQHIESTEQKGVELAQEILIAESAEKLMEGESNNLNLPRIGADAILPQDLPKSARETNHDHDDLARTAGELLTSVRNDQSTKFQQSKFLGLMRMFRDREVVVEGENIVEQGGNADRENDAEKAVGEALWGATQSVAQP